MTTETRGRRTGRTPTDVVERQADAFDASNRARPAREAARRYGAAQAETPLHRRLEASSREDCAVTACANARLRGELRRAVRPVRPIVAHRHGRLRHKLTARLVKHEVFVIPTFEDSADAARAVVLEQPQLVFVEDALPTLSRWRLLRLNDVGIGVAPFIRGGAKALFTRELPSVDIADQRVSCLQADRAAIATRSSTDGNAGE